MKKIDSLPTCHDTPHVSLSRFPSSHVEWLRKVGLGLLAACFLVAPAKAADADLSVSITSAPNPASTGSNLVYTITVTNAGPDTATGVMVTNKLSDGQILAGGGGACPSPGPVAWWKAEGNVNDSVGTNSGVLVGDAAFVTGKVGMAFGLDGTVPDDYVRFLDSPSLQPTDFTIEGWFYPSNVSGIRILVSKTFGVGVLDSFAIYLNGGVINGLLSDASGYDNIGASSALTAGQWYHIAYTFDDASGAHILYTNGAVAASGSTSKSIAYDTNAVIIGADIESGTPSFFYSGLADEVSIYNYALSGTAITNIYAADSEGKCSASTLISIGNLPSATATNVTLTVVATNCAGMITNIVCVTNTVTDPDLSNNMATNVVSVVDLTAPVITCPANITVEAAPGTCSSNVTFSVTATDNCAVTNLTSVPASGFAFPVGVTTVTNTAQDSSGNSNQCTFMVTVNDTEPPMITCSTNITLDAVAGACASNVTFSVTATDNCTVTNVTSVPASGFAFPVGVTTVTNIAYDSSGNTGQCTFTVTVNDTQAPMITCPANITVDAVAGTCSSNVTFSVMATDDCMLTNVVSVPASGSAFPVGVTTVTNTAQDSSGNSSQCNFTVTVIDSEPPVITCSTNITVNATPGACSSNVTFSVTATDNCTVTNVTSVPASGSGFPVGVTTVTNTAYDSSGNSNQCTFTVTVNDTEPPVITCSTNITVDAVATACFSNVTFSVTATDNCTVTNVVSVPASGFAFPIGVTTVTNTAQDSSGNSNQCTFTVTVNDTQPPVITCSTNITVDAVPGACFSNVMFSVTATDDCMLTNVVSMPASGFAFPVGVTTVTNTAQDISGNSSQCTFTVTVIDTQPPVITCSTNITVNAAVGQCGSNVTFSVTATDNCAVTNVVSVPASGFAFPVGVTTVTNTAQDSSGNSSQCTFTVTVIDTQPPVITCSTNITVNAVTGQCASNVTFSVTATDNCAVTNVVSVPASGFAFPVGVTTVTNTAQDSSGNSSQCTFTVTVVDSQPPVITCSTNITVNAVTGQCASNVTFSVTATDNCAVTNVVSVPASGFAFPVGVTTVTNTAQDSSGNSSQCTFTVTVVDSQPPVITCSTNITVNAVAGQCASNVIFTVTATDNCAVTNVTSLPASGFAFPVGITTVTNTAQDSSGNSSECTFAVTVLDTQPPVITCSTNITVNAVAGQCASNVIFTVTATDNCAVTNVTSLPPSGFAFPVGVTTVTNTAQDSSGNSSECTFTVTVLDTQPPVITCSTNITVNAVAGQCASNVIFTVTATDNCAVTNVISVPASGFAFPVGVTTVTNTALDSSGNSSQCTFTVTVIDTQPPVITCSTNITVNAVAGQCSSNVIFTVTATDDCAVTNVTSVPASGFAFPVGVTTVTNTALDSSGNSSQCTFTVTVIDTQPPGITCSTNITVNAVAGQCSSNVIFTVTATDNCAVTNVTSVPASGFAFPVGVTTVTNTALDSSGNSSQCTFTVTVIDTQPPGITCSTNITVNAVAGQCSSNVIFTVTATDNCAVTNVTSVPASGFAFPVGVTTVTNTAQDSSGNSSQCTFTVTVIDTQPPVIICSTNITVNAVAGQCSSNVIFTVTATDNCAVTNVTSVPASGFAFPVGVTTVTNTAQDSSGNSSQCIFTVTVIDTQAPVITCSTNITVNAVAGQCSSNVIFTVTATDNCAVTNVTSVPASGFAFPVGVTTVTNTALDSSGNSSQCTFTVTVIDTQPPVITCSTNITVNAVAGQCSSNVIFTVTATDNCAVTNVTSVPASGFAFPVGVTTVTNTAQDSSGNSSQCTFTVTVIDTQPPVITCSTNITVNAVAGQCSSNVIFTVTATDNCTVTNVVSVPASGFAFPVGVTTVTNTALDSSGNSSQCTFTVTVIDTQPPGITCSTNITVNAVAGQCSSNVIFTVTATDNCAVTNVTSVPASGFAFPVGVTTVTNTAKDSSGNSSQCTFTVTVIDTQPPGITCSTNITVNAVAGQCSSNVIFTVTATDNCAVTNVTSVPASGFAFPVGVTTVTNTAKDSSGNSSQCTFTVTVIDTQPPVITCSTNITVNAVAGQCSSNVIFTVTATDNCTVTNVVSVPASGSAFPVGVTTVTNTAYDSSGNSNQCTFTVTVNDTTPPIIACPTNLTVLCTGTNGAVVMFAATATDNCDPSVVPTCTPPSGSVFHEGTNVVTCEAVDDSGNTNTCTFIIRVDDPAGPPTLSISRQGGDVVICWPVSCATYVLEQTPVLPAIMWTPAGGTLTITGGQYCVNLSITSSNQFFRLRKL